MAYSKGAPQGLPNKVFEYMASGLPILSSLQSETKVLLEKEEIGETYLPSNSNDLFLKMNKIITNLDLIKKMSDKSKKVFETKYDSNIIYKNLIKFLELHSK